MHLPAASTLDSRQSTATASLADLTPICHHCFQGSSDYLEFLPCDISHRIAEHNFYTPDTTSIRRYRHTLKMMRSLFWIALLQYCFAFGPSSTPSRRLCRHGDVASAFSAEAVPSNLMHSSSVIGRKQHRGTILNASNNKDSDIHADLQTENIDTTNMELNAKGNEVGGSSKEEKLGLERETAVVGDPQVAQMETMNITKVLTELQAIQSQGPKKYCILGTRHCSFLHQQIVEML